MPLPGPRTACVTSGSHSISPILKKPPGALLAPLLVPKSKCRNWTSNVLTYVSQGTRVAQLLERPRRHSAYHFLLDRIHLILYGLCMDNITAAFKFFVQKVENFDDDVLEMYAQGFFPCNPSLTDKLAKVATQELLRRARAASFGVTNFALN